MPFAKQQPSNIKHGGAIRPNVCKLTFGPPCINAENKVICVRRETWLNDYLVTNWLLTGY